MIYKNAYLIMRASVLSKVGGVPLVTGDHLYTTHLHFTYTQRSFIYRLDNEKMIKRKE